MAGHRRVVLFAGPSIAPDELGRLVAEVPAEVRVRGPVRQGDVIRALGEAPDVIAIIDGVFFQTPSVGHKEILLAIERGVHVMGASSMGALRAAELDRFGMEGVGEVYRLYRDGAIDGDDMVALTHAAGEDGYRATSEPLVNLRHNVMRARRAGIVRADTARTVLGCAQRMYFPDRVQPRILRSAGEAGADAGDLHRLAAFLREHAEDLKLADARLLLRVLPRRVAAPPAAPPLTVNRTTYLQLQLNEYDGTRVGERHLADRFVVDLQRLLVPRFAAVARRGGLRCLALDEAGERRVAPAGPAELLQRFTPWLTRAGAARQRWLDRRGLTHDDLIRTLTERDLERRVRELLLAERGGRPADTSRILVSVVSRRTGIPAADLRRRPLMHPGVPWDGPLVRELKVRGAFRRAQQRAARMSQLRDDFENQRPGLLATLDPDSLFNWYAWRWQVPLERMRVERERRGFLGDDDFLAVARAAFPADWLAARRGGDLLDAPAQFRSE